MPVYGLQVSLPVARSNEAYWPVGFTWFGNGARTIQVTTDPAFRTFSSIEVAGLSTADTSVLHGQFDFLPGVTYYWRIMSFVTGDEGNNPVPVYEYGSWWTVPLMPQNYAVVPRELGVMNESPVVVLAAPGKGGSSQSDYVSDGRGGGMPANPNSVSRVNFPGQVGTVGLQWIGAAGSGEGIATVVQISSTPIFEPGLTVNHELGQWWDQTANIVGLPGDQVFYWRVITQWQYPDGALIDNLTSEVKSFQTVSRISPPGSTMPIPPSGLQVTSQVISDDLFHVAAEFTWIPVQGPGQPTHDQTPIIAISGPEGMLELSGVGAYMTVQGLLPGAQYSWTVSQPWEYPYGTINWLISEPMTFKTVSGVSTGLGQLYSPATDLRVTGFTPFGAGGYFDVQFAWNAPVISNNGQPDEVWLDMYPGWGGEPFSNFASIAGELVTGRTSYQTTYQYSASQQWFARLNTKFQGNWYPSPIISLTTPSIFQPPNTGGGSGLMVRYEDTGPNDTDLLFSWVPGSSGQSFLDIGPDATFPDGSYIPYTLGATQNFLRLSGFVRGSHLFARLTNLDLGVWTWGPSVPVDIPISAGTAFQPAKNLTVAFEGQVAVFNWTPPVANVGPDSIFFDISLVNQFVWPNFYSYPADHISSQRVSTLIPGTHYWARVNIRNNDGIWYSSNVIEFDVPVVQSSVVAPPILPLLAGWPVQLPNGLYQRNVSWTAPTPSPATFLISVHTDGGMQAEDYPIGQYALLGGRQVKISLIDLPPGSKISWWVKSLSPEGIQSVPVYGKDFYVPIMPGPPYIYPINPQGTFRINGTARYHGEPISLTVSYDILVGAYHHVHTFYSNPIQAVGEQTFTYDTGNIQFDNAWPRGVYSLKLSIRKTSDGSLLYPLANDKQVYDNLWELLA